MKSDFKVKDPLKRPICPRERPDNNTPEMCILRIPRRTKFKGETANEFNKNFKTMPKGF